MNSYDLDGVIYMGRELGLGLRPSPEDVIVTGRSYEEAPETYEWLHHHGIRNAVFFNPLPFDKKTRESSGEHKSVILRYLKSVKSNVVFHFEDDPIQAEVIKRKVDGVEVILLQHDLTEKENVRHDQWHPADDVLEELRS